LTIKKEYNREIAYNSRQDFIALEVNNLMENFSNLPKFGLDIGAQDGRLTKKIAEITKVPFVGLEPQVNVDLSLVNGVQIFKGQSDSLPFSDNSFDVVTAISVFEHIEPILISQTLKEIERVLKFGGILVIQMPNMLFPIETHSMLPFQQFLPKKIAIKYLKRFSVNKDYDGNWFRTSPQKIIKDSKDIRLTYSVKILLDPWVINISNFP